MLGSAESFLGWRRQRAAAASVTALDGPRLYIRRAMPGHDRGTFERSGTFFLGEFGSPAGTTVHPKRTLVKPAHVLKLLILMATYLAPGTLKMDLGTPGVRIKGA
jgi:hypothetical protein